jgi:acyl-CoA dehydrogenase
VSFDISRPTAGTSVYLQDQSLRLLVTFFQNKGLAELKQEDRQEDWYQDWITYQARHGLYASVLSPRRYSSRGHRFDISKLARFVEAFSYFSPAHAYSMHVSLLGLFPILMSANEPLKKEAVAKLEEGGLFAFAISEKAHGADLFANQFTVRSTGATGLPATGPHSGWLADGAKYYIGNANAACLISVLAKKVDARSASTGKRAPFVFFALRPRETPAFRNLRKIHTLGIRTAFVGAFEVTGYPFPESDLISQGREAWDAVRATVNFGKFFLGFGAIGICEHALAEAVDYMQHRGLYGKHVLAMPHIREALAFAFVRLTAMKFYAYRALDYLQASCDADRRYLLWSAVQKARVSTEGVKVMALLSECIGARGFEAETYFEAALRDSQLIPSLEGSTHINFGLTAQFLVTYFADPGCEVPEPKSMIGHQADNDENPYWMAARDRNARTVRFAHYLKAYEPLHAVSNVRSFVKQVKAFRLFAGSNSDPNSSQDGAPAISHAELGASGLLMAMGKCLSIIAYAQLLAESCLALHVAPSIVSIIFHGLIEDLGAEALKLSAMLPARSPQRSLLKGVVRMPRKATADLQTVSEFIAARYGT